MLSHINVKLTFRDIEQKLKLPSDRPEILETAKRIFNQAQGIWRPKAVYQWFEFENAGKDNSGCIIQRSGNHLRFAFGHSFQFLKHSRYALISVYTSGHRFEKESKHASFKRDLLEAYFLDLIGLTVLDQVGRTIKGIAEKQARNLGWGVSPFLSPGSVYGWDLEEQVKLCSLLPLKKIDVKVQENAALYPLKTVSCLIGLGPAYKSALVGTACQVCSKNEECLMRQNGNTGRDA